MSDLLLQPEHAREPLQASFSDQDNPVGLDGVEFVEYATSQPQALGQVLEMMGFRPVARHRSREVLLYRQGGLNIVVNAHPLEEGGAANTGAQPSISAIALRVRDARSAYRYALERGGWEVPTHPEPMELNIPAIHGVGGTRIYFVDRYRDFSIYDVDFVPIPSVNPRPPALAGIHFFGIVQYIGTGRSYDWIEFYGALFGIQAIPDEQRFGILPSGKLLRAPAVSSANRFMLQLIEPELDAEDEGERLQRIGLGVPDVLAAVRALRVCGMEFVETEAAHTERRGAITKTYLGNVVFELVHSEPAVAPVNP
ncbi:MAG TPA: 4-hydroxyphenylpyruvate dioxygenase [Ramlibacter sp.]|nr:4-hydroxyphenylpyruvate dioxygenase [Ramlibacter sp.]